MVFYFTATGNSMYVAKKLDTDIISIPRVMHSENLEFEDETIGIVCPVFCNRLPQLVVDFMKKARFKTEYLYMIMTYGNHHGGAAGFTERIVRNKCGIKIDYIRNILMVDNYLPVFDMNDQTAIDKQVDEQITAAIHDIAARKKEIPELILKERVGHAILMLFNKIMPSFNNGRQITVTDRCVGCGICAKVCPLGLFFVENSKADRRENTCAFCLACAQNCPNKAITMRSADKNPEARYRNEHITLQEILDSNNQK